MSNPCPSKIHDLSSISRLISLVAMVFVLGCSQSTIEPDATVSSSPRSELPAVNADQNVPIASDITKEEAEAYALQWQNAVINNDVTKARELLDWNAIFSRSMDGLVTDKNFRKGFLSGASGAAQNLIGTIHGSIQETGSYELVSTIHRGDEQHAVFRLYDDVGGMNYHDIRLTRDGGRIIGDELFIAATGEAFSDSVRSLVASAVVSQQSLAGRISGQAEKELERLQLQKEMNTAFKSGDPQKALEIYDSFPADMKKKKFPMLIRIMATPVENEAEYKAAVEEYIEQFPGDASVGLISIDAAVMRQDPEMLKNAYTALATWTGGDQFLDVMIAAVLANLGDLESAKEMLSGIETRESENVHIHDFSLSVALASDDHPETLARLRILRDEFGYEFTDLREVEEYNAFCASPEFQQWNQ